MAKQPRYNLRHRRIGRNLPGEFPTHHSQNSDAPLDSSDAPRDVEGVSDAAGDPPASGPQPRALYSHAASSCNPSLVTTGKADPARTTQPVEVFSADATFSLEPTRGEESVEPTRTPVIKMEPRGEEQWHYVGRDGRHSPTPSRRSIRSAGGRLEGGIPLIEELTAATNHAERDMSNAQLAEHHSQLIMASQRARLEYEERLCQLEAEGWHDEQQSCVSYTDTASMTTQPGSAPIKADEPVLGEQDTDYPEEEFGVIEEVPEELDEGSRWEYLPAPTAPPPVFSPMAPVAESTVWRNDRLDELAEQVAALTKLLAGNHAVHTRVDSNAIHLPEPASTPQSHMPFTPSTAATTAGASASAKRSKDKKKKKKESILSGKRGTPPSDDGSSSSSSSSSSSDAGSGVSLESSSDEDEVPAKKKSKRKAKKPMLKPINPEGYDGRADAEAFHKFTVSDLSDSEESASVSSATTTFYSCDDGAEVFCPEKAEVNLDIEDDEISFSSEYEGRYLPHIKPKGEWGYHFGDAHAANAARVLNGVLNVVYPYRDEDKLDIYLTRISDDQYVIEWYDTAHYVPVASILDPEFDIARWYFPLLNENMGGELLYDDVPSCPLGPALASEVREALSRLIDTPGPDDLDWPGGTRFATVQRHGYVELHDLYLAFELYIPNELLENAYLDLRNWYAQVLRRELRPAAFDLDDLEGELPMLFETPSNVPLCVVDTLFRSYTELQCFAVKVSKNDSAEYLQRNASEAKDMDRIMPEPAVVVVMIDGHPVRALLDSGSLSDFMSTKLAHQLRLKTYELDKPLPVLMAVQGSRAKVNLGCVAKMEYQDISEDRYFDVMNILNYDLILGTPFLYQHRITIGLNPTSVVVGSNDALPLMGKRMRTLEAHAAGIVEDDLQKYRDTLREYAQSISTNAMNSPLPPLRDINHTIPLIDDDMIYSWRPSKCPEALRPMWNEKREAYLNTGRWRMTNARNTSPMLLLTKPGTGKNGVPPRLRTVIDLRQRNKNTKKLPSPLPDMEGILRRVSRRPYRSMIDGKDAYEQIRVAPDHVDRTAMATPDGSMVSLVLQQGDCNAVATYQSLMNHIFGSYIGDFMDVYLDDIIIYSNTVEDHLRHVQLVIDALRAEKFYLSADKQKYFCRDAKILGRIVDDFGIRMDPEKVDSILTWKIPTNKELLRGFLGSVGYLADDIATIRIPMGILTSLIGSDSSFKWDHTHQRAFDEVKQLVQAHREHHRMPLDYSHGADPIWLVTDGSHGGIAGIVCQGPDFRTGRIAAFFSAKLTAAQSNYAVHEIEMLAGVEAMLRHRDILQGCDFTWVTDHKGLTHLWTQKNLSGRQARWMEKLSEFSFDIEYVPGVENVLADALSRIYSNDAPGTVRAPSEYTQFDETSMVPAQLNAVGISAPVFAGLEAMAVRTRSATGTTTRSVSTKTVIDARGRRDTHLAKRVVPAPKPSPPALQKPASKARSAPKKRVALKDLPPPETGRPETSREFAKRITRVTLHGPRAQRQEGGNLAGSAQTRSTQPEPTSNGSAQTRSTQPEPTSNEHRPRQAWVSDELEGLSPEAQDAVLTDEHEHLTRDHGLVEHLASELEGVDLAAEVRNRYQEDPFFDDILRNPKHFKNFSIQDGLIFLKDNSTERMCLPNVTSNGRSVREIAIRHAHSLLAHLGATKTLGYLRDQVWWKTMGQDVQKYCDTCMTCKRSKPSNQKPYGLLNPLPVASAPWEAIGIDFVGPLPESKDRDATYDAITTIIDLLTGMVHLVPSRTNYTAKQVAELIFAEVYKLHGMPKAIISDRDVLFTSQFWTHLHKLVGVELHLSSAYHPQSDGSTERANRTITQMLRQCVSPSQKDWVTRLPGIEFALNLARSESTGYALFFLNSGRMPRSMIWEDAGKDEYPSVRVYAQKVKYAIMAAHDSIIAARVKQTRDANRRRRPAPFVTGDLVYLSTKNISLPRGLARKLALKYIGPYKILEDYKNNSYKVDLSRNLKRRGVHDIFHSSLLRIHEPNDDRLFPGRLDSQIAELEDRDNEWAIARIVSHTGEREGALFEAEWKSGDRTWVPYSAIRHLGALTEYLELLGYADVTQLSIGNEEPPADPQIYVGFLGPTGATTMHIRRRRSRRRRHRKTHSSLRPHSLSSSSPPVSSDSPLAAPEHSSFYAYLADLFKNIAMSDNRQHACFRRTSNRLDGLLRDGNTDVEYFYSVVQLRAIASFDQRLRIYASDGEDNVRGLTVPGGYDAFARMWSRDTECTYQFSRYDPATGRIDIRGQPIPIDDFAPRQENRGVPSQPSEGKQQAAQQPGDGVSKGSRSKKIYQHLLESNAESDMRRRGFIDAKKADRARARFQRELFGAGGDSQQQRPLFVAPATPVPVPDVPAIATLTSTPVEVAAPVTVVQDVEMEDALNPKLIDFSDDKNEMTQTEENSEVRQTRASTAKGKEKAQ
ncbi:hypothetical protein EVJ58_g270 [Rhodofomes roseus]|uniref:RNA-directed DNA polymerase n=1 Tax=Rhodofomes roseus TaxID=34475 RepID=A0A4Y9Z8H7_9APHY|nr:hypothetical protein EVJ58_g270 [Rhodofomes roseus]